MSRAKPLSMEEKTKRILSLLQEKDEPFRVSELEKISQKEKGVVPQSIKEILEILVSEKKIKEKKIGSSIYFWSFLSDVKINRENEFIKLTEEVLKAKSQEKILIEELYVIEKNRSTLPDRKEKIKELVAKQQECKELNEMVKKIDENNPSKIQAMSEELAALGADLSAWADRFNILQSYIKNTYNMTQKEFCQAFSISMQDVEKIEEI